MQLMLSNDLVRFVFLHYVSVTKDVKDEDYPMNELNFSCTKPFLGQPLHLFGCVSGLISSVLIIS